MSTPIVDQLEEEIQQLQSQLQAKEQELAEVKESKENVENEYINRVHDFAHEKLTLITRIEQQAERIKVLEEALTYIANKSFPINKQGLSKVKFPDQIAREALEDK